MDLMRRRLTAQLSRRQPFCLSGPAGTGKTALMKEFSAKFSNFIRLDLETAEDRAIFAEPAGPEEILRAISFRKNKEIRGSGTLLFLDEIGQCPGAIRWVREWLERTREQTGIPTARPFVTAASSLRSEETDRLTDPVTGGLQSWFLPPLSFEEYLSATGDGTALESFLEVPVPRYAHDRLLDHFHRYSLIGGMPAVVSAYTQGEGLTRLREHYEALGQALLRLLPRVTAAGPGRRLAAEVLQNAWPFAATRITLRNFGNLGKGSREIGRAFRALEDLLCCRLVQPSDAHTPGCPPGAVRSPRLHLADTGMVNYFSGIQQALFRAHDMNALFRGQIARQAVAQEMSAAMTLTATQENTTNASPLQRLPAPGFWVRRKAQSTAEVDFLLPLGDLLLPVVVRTGEPGRLRGLHQFVDAAPHPFAVRLHAGELGVRETRTLAGKKFYLLSLPYFLAGRIGEHAEGFLRYVTR